jgi:DNA invertase Pin-like site-specific DNA recombinase
LLTATCAALYLRVSTGLQAEPHSFSQLFRDALGLEFYLRKLAKHGVRLVSITQELVEQRPCA